MKNKIEINLNGQKKTFEVFPMKRLLDLLRQDAGVTSVKEGCGEGECGSCVVLLNGDLVNSCLVPAIQAHQTEVTTLEGIQRDELFHQLERAFLEKGGVQCGFCTPGIILASYYFLQSKKSPSETREHLSGNLCRCTGYSGILDAIQEVMESRK